MSCKEQGRSFKLPDVEWGASGRRRESDSLASQRDQFGSGFMEVVTLRLIHIGGISDR